MVVLSPWHTTYGVVQSRLAEGERLDDEELRRQLEPEERLLWSGRPPAGVLFRPADGFLIPFSLVWCGFAIFWEGATLRTGAPAFFSLWGIPFIAIGLYLVVGRFFVDAWLRSRTLYGVTDSRILLVSRGWTQKVPSLAIRNLAEIGLREGANGRGTITFGPETPWWMGMQGWPGGMQQARSPAFESIDDAQRVLRLIRDVQRKA
jgi:hypothetical protein